MINKPIRILHIINSMNMGGAETMIMNIYRHIDRSRFQFDFFLSTNEEGYYEKEILSLGGNIYRTKPKSKHPIKYFRDLKKIVIKNRYSISHVHSSTAKDFYSIKILKKFNVKKRIYHSHSSMGSNKLVQFISRIYLNKSLTNKIACSDLAAKWMYGNKSNEATIIYNPINVRRFKFNMEDRLSVIKELNLENKKVFIHVGRFSNVKNHDFLIDIFKEIVAINVNSILLLIGSGENKDKILSKINQNELTKHVIILGIKEDVYKYMSASDLFIMPSFFEGLPISIIEAQANGLPSIISNSITRDIKKTNLVTFASLKDEAREWALSAIELIKDDLVDRESYNEPLKELYDTSVITNELKKIYLSKELLNDN